MSDSLDPAEIFFNKKPNKTYVSKKVSPTDYPDSIPFEEYRMISRVFDGDELHEFATLKDEMVIYVSPNQRVEVKAKFYEDTRKIQALTIQRYERRTGKPHKETHLTFDRRMLGEFIKFLRAIQVIPLDDRGKSQFTNDYIETLLLEDDEKLAFFRANLELVAQLARSEITENDIVALGYRKKQLEIFQKLLDNPTFFDECRRKWQVRQSGNEAVWQRFFEDNTWIFGYGLNYIFNAPLDRQKLEQITSGYTFNQSGKRVDALMKTKGVISSLCFVEIKTDKTPLLSGKHYRADCWPVSDELSGSVAQIQKTVQRAIQDIHTKLDITTEEGDLTGEVIYLYQPKSYVVIGNLSEFVSKNHTVNESKYSSFELFRRNVTNPEIITFDELYERAKFIVRHSEDSETSENADNEFTPSTEPDDFAPPPPDLDEIPF